MNGIAARRAAVGVASAADEGRGRVGGPRQRGAPARRRPSWAAGVDAARRDVDFGPIGATDRRRRGPAGPRARRAEHGMQRDGEPTRERPRDALASVSTAAAVPREVPVSTTTVLGVRIRAPRSPLLLRTSKSAPRKERRRPASKILHRRRRFPATRRPRHSKANSRPASTK